MIICSECGENVEFNSQKQNYYTEHSFPYPPMFCSNCHNRRLSKIWNFSGLNRTATCANCQKEIILRFTPNGEFPVKCNQCHKTTTKK